MTGLHLLVGLFAAGAAAPVQVEPSAVAKAQAYLDLAGHLFDARDFTGALAELERAEPLMAGDPAQAMVRFNIARCLEELGRSADAARAYERYLVGVDEERRRRRARAALDRLLAERVGVLAVRCTPEAARVQVVGAPPQLCPVELRLTAGPVEVDVAHEGFVTHRFSWHVPAGGRVEVRAALEPTPLAPPKWPPPMPPVAIAPPPLVAPAVAPVAVPTPRHGLPIALMVAGGGVALTGAVLHILSIDERDSGTRSTGGGSRCALETRQTLAFGGYALGALVAGLGVWVFMDTPPPGATDPTGDGPGFAR